MTLLVTADRMMLQAFSQIGKKAETAWAFAFVLKATADKHPLFWDFLLAQFHYSCPYTVPMFPQQLPGQSDRDYKINTLKYKKAIEEDGSEGVEPLPSYVQRMTGVIHLYCSLMAVPNGPDSYPNSHYLWHWLVRFLPLKPTPLSGNLLLSFLESTNYFLNHGYGTQYHKLRAAIGAQWLPSMPTTTENAKAARFQLMIALDELPKKDSQPPDAAHITD